MFSVVDPSVFSAFSAVSLSVSSAFSAVNPSARSTLYFTAIAKSWFRLATNSTPLAGTAVE